jgi:iron-sulfur cluster repair protein YtfE (RIC family)
MVALSACKREPSFDERYAGAQKAIREKASELDQDMAWHIFAETDLLFPRAQRSCPAA